MKLVPPSDQLTARALLRSVLRARRRLIAEAELLPWSPKISDIAKAGGVDRATVKAWLGKSRNLGTTHGRAVFDGGAALSLAQWLDPAVRTPSDALACLDQQLASKRPRKASRDGDQCDPIMLGKSLAHQQVLERDAGPFPFRSLAFSDIGDVLDGVASAFAEPMQVAEPGYTPIGLARTPVTVDELAALAPTKISTKNVRKILAECGLNVARRETIDSNWFSSEAGKRFWSRVAKNKTAA